MTNCGDLLSSWICGVLYWSALHWHWLVQSTIYNLQRVNPGGSHFIVSIKDAANTPAWRWFLFETQIWILFWWIHILIKIRFVSTVVLEWSCQVCWDNVDHDNRDHHDRRDRHESMTMMLIMIIMILPGGIDANSTMISSVEFWDAATGRWAISAVQKTQKLSESPTTVPIVAKICIIDSKKRKIAEKLVQPVTPHLSCFQWGLQWENSRKWVFGHLMSWEHVRAV